MTTSGLLAALILGSFFHFDMGPAMTRPTTQVPPAWTAAVSGDLVTPQTAWWTLFREPVLDRCVEEAFRNNRDLEQALARVEQARAVLGETRGQQSPELDLKVNTARARVIEGANGSSSPTNTNDVLGAVSYEADLWSKLRKATTAAKLQLLSSEAARDTVRLSLAGQVAKAYFSLRGQDQQLQIAQETLQTRKEALALRKLLYEKGRTSELDYRQDQSETAVAAVKVRQMENAVARSEHALLVLMGRNPQEQVANQVTRGVSLDALPQPPEIPPGLPSQLLERRPDIRQSEQDYLAALAKIGEAKAAQFPTLSLTGLFGSASPELEDLFTGPTAWELAGKLLAPLVDGGKRKSRVKKAEAAARESLGIYDQTVRTAFQETLDALVGNTKAQEILTLQTEQEKAQSRAYELAKAKYEGGYASHLDLLDAQRQLFQVQLDLEGSRTDRLNAVVDLCLALGGGWDTASPDQTPKAQAPKP